MEIFYLHDFHPRTKKHYLPEWLTGSNMAFGSDMECQNPWAFKKIVVENGFWRGDVCAF